MQLRPRAPFRSAVLDRRAGVTSRTPSGQVPEARGIDALEHPKHHGNMGHTDLPGSPDRHEPWRELFGQGSASEILPRLIQGDRLELWPRCVERITTRCHLIDVERLYYRSVARIAHAGPKYRGRPAFDEFLKGRIDESLNELMREDQEEERRGTPPEPGDSARFRFLNEVLGMEMSVTRGAVVRFNVLDEEVRQTFFALVVEMKRFNRHLAEGNGPPDKVRAQLREAFEAIGASYDEWRTREGDAR